MGEAAQPAKVPYFVWAVNSLYNFSRREGFLLKLPLHACGHASAPFSREGNRLQRKCVSTGVFHCQRNWLQAEAFPGNLVSQPCAQPRIVDLRLSFPKGGR